MKIENSYDATSKITVHIGAFRFVCTNLAVGGGGVFAGGFMAVHAGEIPVEEALERLVRYLADFPAVVELYRVWAESPADLEQLLPLIHRLPKKAETQIRLAVAEGRMRTVWDTYNAATWYATHQLRSARAAFAVLERINRGFQTLTPAQVAAAH